MMSFGNTVLVAKNKSETTKQMKGGSGASLTHTPLYTFVHLHRCNGFYTVQTVYFKFSKHITWCEL